MQEQNTCSWFSEETKTILKYMAKNYAATWIPAQYAINELIALCRFCEKEPLTYTETDLSGYLNYFIQRQAAYQTIYRKFRAIDELELFMCQNEGNIPGTRTRTYPMHVMKQREKNNPYVKSDWFSNDFITAADYMLKNAVSAPRPINYSINVAAEICNLVKKDFFSIQMEDAHAYLDYLKNTKELAPATISNHGAVLQYIKDYILQHKEDIGITAEFTEQIPYKEYFNQSLTIPRQEKSNMVGRIFNDLKVMEKDDSKAVYSRTAWLCQCKCGNKVLATTYQLTHNLKTDCGDRKRHSQDKRTDLSGQTIGCFEVLRKSKQKVNGRLAYDCRCLACGQIKPIRASKITRKEINSCGCRQNIKNRSHKPR